MLSKCGVNKPMGKCFTDALPHFDACFDLFLNRAQQRGIFVYQCYIKKNYASVI